MRTLRIPAPGESAIAQSVAHELNNIAASMLGFLELATTNASHDPPLRNSLDELRIGVDRMIHLAGILQRFGETDGRPTVVALADCLPEARPSGAAAGVRIEWSGDAGASVIADPVRVRSALEILVELAPSNRAAESPTVLRVERSKAARLRCGACGQAVPAGHVRVSLHDDALRMHGRPRAARGAGTSFGALMLDACSHLAHLGGAHLAIDQLDGSCALLIMAVPAGPRASRSGPRRGNPQRSRSKSQGGHRKTAN